MWDSFTTFQQGLICGFILGEFVAVLVIALFLMLDERRPGT